MFWGGIFLRIVHKRRRDRQRIYPAGSCGRCGGELYPGDVCWLLGGRTMCRECAAAWALEELAAFRGVCGEARP